MVDSKNWFKSWFDSPYYHLLYDKRDENEAKQFLNALILHLNPHPDSKILDLACGKGRHSIHLNKMGYDVLGVDLSEESINHAKRFENNSLHFQKGDMRNLCLDRKFDLTLNLFTSFGYFLEEKENIKVIQSLENILSLGGSILIDYLNCFKTIQNLPSEEEINKHNINFLTKKSIENGFIVKEIEFQDKGESFFFKEFVKLIELKDFMRYFELCGLEIYEYFGDYKLNPFIEEESERLIMLVKRKQ